MKKAQDFLNEVEEVLAERGKVYDEDEEQEERSMGKAIGAFNIITGMSLRTSEGWLLLQILKDVRQWSKRDQYHEDSALDAVAYAALKAESLSEQD